MKRAGLALGSNLGDKSSLIKQARDACKALDKSGLFLQSALYATEPVGCPEGSDRYLNAVIELGWGQSPGELLVKCQQIERDLGRIRSGIACEPRTVDIDILYIDGTVCDSTELTLPHPRLHQRKFVLQPLSDIRPELVLPDTAKTVTEQLDSLDTDEPPPAIVAANW